MSQRVGFRHHGIGRQFNQRVELQILGDLQIVGERDVYGAAADPVEDILLMQSRIG